jgi:hypothetical protein
VWVELRLALLLSAGAFIGWANWFVGVRIDSAYHG